jgi:4-amino-4-deoxy-L-arabinose transferase-like glycosyltransferase
MDKDCFSQISHWRLVVLLLIVAYFILMFGNGIVSLTHPDEVFYTQTAKEMLIHKSWLTPILFDGPHFEKPFLFFGLLALGVKWFGLTPFVSRFWPAFFGILGVCITYWIAWMLFERKRLAFLAGLILSSSFIYLVLSRAVLTDMVFSIWVVISIGFFYFSYRYAKYRDSGIFLCFFFSAIAVLTKGILGFTFPAAVILIFLAYKKDLAFLKAKSTWLGLIIFFIVALPWHILMYKLYGQWFIDEYFRNVHVRRLFHAEHAKIDTWYFYFGVMFGGVLPWSLYLIPAGRDAFKEFKHKTDKREKLFFLLSWIAGIYIFVQPAHSKLASYIFPVFPAIAIIIAYYLHHSLEKAQNNDMPKSFKICGHTMSLLLMGVAVAAIIYGRAHIDMVVHMGPIYVFAVSLFCVALIIFGFNNSGKYTQMIMAHVGMTLSVLMMLFLARPYIEPWVSCKDITDVLKKIDQSQTTVLASKFYVRGVRFYTDRPAAVIDINGKGFFSPHPIPFLNTEQKVLDFLDSQPVTFAVVKYGNVKDLERILYDRPYRVEELEGIGGKYILRIEKL